MKDSKVGGYTAVEGYPRLHEQRDAYNYTGPFRLYENFGFIKVAVQGNVAIMRKEL